MKRIYQIWQVCTMIVLVFGMTAFNAFSQDYEYNDSWGKHGFQLNSQKSSGVEVNYSIRSFSMGKDVINGETMDVLGLPGTFLPNNEGAPNLPGEGRFIAVPQGASATVEIIASRTETFKNVEMAPAPRIPWETETGPLDYAKDPEIYTKDAFYPETPVLLSEVTQIRGVDAVTLGITPFQYNPVTKELIVYRDLQVSVDFQGGNGQFGEERLRSRWWDPLLSDMLLNFETLPKVNYNKSFQAAETTGCEYLILTPTNPEFLQWADSIKEFRTKQGIMTDIMTVEDAGGNNVSTLESFFNDAYAEWDIPPAAVLILGDYGSNSSNSITSPIWNNYCASDNIWSDVTGNDMPDIVFARMTAQNANHLETMVTKFLDYERTPPTSEDFYQNPITALGFQTERWFQICSESVAGFWENELGKTANRINKTYAGNPTSDPWSTATNTSTVLNIFGPNGLGYIPATPAQVNCTWNGSAQDVVNGINDGAFMLQHRDHGFEQGWGEPSFTSSNINSLNNTDLVFVWSINCLTGKYNMSGECFTEKFHRYTYGGENSGALGLNAASEVSYSFVNDTYVWGAYDNMWPDFLPSYGSTPVERGIYPSFGMAAGKYFLWQSGWPYNTSNKEVTYNLFHHHGDAFNTVYTVMPMDLTVTHNPILYAGVDFFEVTANEGALIALTVNGEIIGTAEGTGAPVSIGIPAQQPPDQLLVTITLQDYYRYEQLVEIIPPAGPYIVQSTVELNDESGNGNGLMETSESILASLTVENVGVENAENVTVTLTTSDEYITLTDDTEEYGNVAAGGTAMVEDGFAWEVADNIPDMHNVIVEVNATDGSDTWVTSFVIQGHAPYLEVGTLTINDEAGNGNGRLDPGEDAEIIIETYNSGSFHALNAAGTIGISSGYVTVTNTTYDFNVIGAGLMEEATYSISVSENAPIGTVVSIAYDVVSGGYAITENFAETIGLIVEDWETGDMGQYEWSTGGNADWFITDSNPFEGNYCVESGDIGDQALTWLELEYEVFGDDVISFAYKVSSEGSYDYLRFYIDNNEMGSWAGDVAWSTVEFDVTAGLHTFRWEYDKDYSVSTGADCAWIDFIILPAPPVTTAYAGPDDETCGSMPYSTQGAATLYTLVNWSTSGSGTFDDSQTLEAVYSPSDEDVTNGSVTLTLTAYSPDLQVSDEMLLTLAGAPEAYAGEDMMACPDQAFGMMDATAVNEVSVLWTTSGDGSFSDDQIINTVYLAGDEDIANGMVTLTFTVTGSDACDEAMDDILVTFTEAATASAGGDASICEDDIYTFAEATAENYTALMWTTDGDGTFDDATAMHPVYTPGPNDIENGSATITFTATGYSGCGDTEVQTLLSLDKMPEAFAGEDASIGNGATYTIDDAMAMNYEQMEWSTSGDGTFDDPVAMHPTYTPGANDIEAKEVVLTLDVHGAEACGNVSDDLMLSIETGVGENLAGFDLRLYPNPNGGNFNLELNGNRNEVVTIRIFNALGEEVYVRENVEINGTYSENIVLDVHQGIYTLRIEGESLLVNRKVLIRK